MAILPPTLKRVENLSDLLFSPQTKEGQVLSQVMVSEDFDFFDTNENDIYFYKEEENVQIALVFESRKEIEDVKGILRDAGHLIGRTALKQDYHFVPNADSIFEKLNTYENVEIVAEDDEASYSGFSTTKRRYYVRFLNLIEGEEIPFSQASNNELFLFNKENYESTTIFTKDIENQCNTIEEKLNKCYEFAQSDKYDLNVDTKSTSFFVSGFPSTIARLLKTNGYDYRTNEDDFVTLFYAFNDISEGGVYVNSTFYTEANESKFFVPQDPNSPANLDNTNALLESEQYKRTKVQEICINKREALFIRELTKDNYPEYLEYAFGTYHKKTNPLGFKVKTKTEFETIKNKREKEQEVTAVEEVLKSTREALQYKGGMTYEFDLNFTPEELRKKLMKAKNPKEQILIVQQEMIKVFGGDWNGFAGIALACVISKTPLEDLLSDMCDWILECAGIDDSMADKIINYVTMEELRAIAGDVSQAWEGKVSNNDLLNYLPNYTEDLGEAANKTTQYREKAQAAIFNFGKYEAYGFEVNILDIIKNGSNKDLLCLLLLALLAALIICMLYPEKCKFNLGLLTLPLFPELSMPDLLKKVSDEFERLINTIIANLLVELVSKMIAAIEEFCNIPFSTDLEEQFGPFVKQYDDFVERWQKGLDELFNTDFYSEPKEKCEEAPDTIVVEFPIEEEPCSVNFGDKGDVNAQYIPIENVEKRCVEEIESIQSALTKENKEKFDKFVSDLSSLLTEDQFCKLLNGQPVNRRSIVLINQLIDQKYPTLNALKNQENLEYVMKEMGNYTSCEEYYKNENKKKERFATFACDLKSDPASAIENARRVIFEKPPLTVEEANKLNEEEKERTQAALKSLVGPVIGVKDPESDPNNPDNGIVGPDGVVSLAYKGIGDDPELNPTDLSTNIVIRNYTDVVKRTVEFEVENTIQSISINPKYRLLVLANPAIIDFLNLSEKEVYASLVFKEILESNDSIRVELEEDLVRFRLVNPFSEKEMIYETEQDQYTFDVAGIKVGGGKQDVDIENLHSKSPIQIQAFNSWLDKDNTYTYPEREEINRYLVQGGYSNSLDGFIQNIARQTSYSSLFDVNNILTTKFSSESDLMLINDQDISPLNSEFRIKEFYDDNVPVFDDMKQFEKYGSHVIEPDPLELSIFKDVIEYYLVNVYITEFALQSIFTTSQFNMNSPSKDPVLGDYIYYKIVNGLSDEQYKDFVNYFMRFIEFKKLNGEVAEGSPRDALKTVSMQLFYITEEELMGLDYKEEIQKLIKSRAAFIFRKVSDELDKIFKEETSKPIENRFLDDWIATVDRQLYANPNIQRLMIVNDWFNGFDDKEAYFKTTKSDNNFYNGDFILETYLDVKPVMAEEGSNNLFKIDDEFKKKGIVTFYPSSYVGKVSLRDWDAFWDGVPKNLIKEELKKLEEELGILESILEGFSNSEGIDQTIEVQQTKQIENKKKEILDKQKEIEDTFLGDEKWEDLFEHIRLGLRLLYVPGLNDNKYLDNMKNAEQVIENEKIGKLTFSHTISYFEMFNSEKDVELDSSIFFGNELDVDSKVVNADELYNLTIMKKELIKDNEEDFEFLFDSVLNIPTMLSLVQSYSDWLLGDNSVLKGSKKLIVDMFTSLVPEVDDSGYPTQTGWYYSREKKRQKKRQKVKEN